MIPTGMLPEIRFTKMHGLGNDFVILNEFGVGFSQSPVFVDAKLASQLSDRRFGVGCDQLLVVGPARDARSHARMDVWNPDGSRAEMCGNGIRAVALFLHDHGPERLKGRSSYDIETAAGVKTVTLQGRQVRVNMGAPVFMSIRPESLNTQVGVLEFWEVNMGNPHAVIFVPQVDQIELEKVGPILENHSRFERRTNVEFVQVLSRLIFGYECGSEERERLWLVEQAPVHPRSRQSFRMRRTLDSL